MESNQISNSTQRIAPSPNRPQRGSGVEQAGKSFQEALESLSSDEANNDTLLQQMATGEDINIHQAVAAAEETDINFRIAMAIRDRLVDAYREVMRMAI